MVRPPVNLSSANACRTVAPGLIVGATAGKGCLAVPNLNVGMDLDGDCAANENEKVRCLGKDFLRWADVFHRDVGEGGDFEFPET